MGSCFLPNSMFGCSCPLGNSLTTNAVLLRKLTVILFASPPVWMVDTTVPCNYFYLQENCPGATCDWVPGANMCVKDGTDRIASVPCFRPSFSLAHNCVSWIFLYVFLSSTITVSQIRFASVLFLTLRFLFFMAQVSSLRANCSVGTKMPAPQVVASTTRRSACVGRRTSPFRATTTIPTSFAPLWTTANGSCPRIFLVSVSIAPSARIAQRPTSAQRSTIRQTRDWRAASTPPTTPAPTHGVCFNGVMARARTRTAFVAWLCATISMTRTAARATRRALGTLPRTAATSRAARSRACATTTVLSARPHGAPGKQPLTCATTPRPPLIAVTTQRVPHAPRLAASGLPASTGASTRAKTLPATSTTTQPRVPRKG